MDDELKALIETARRYQMTAEQREAQRISFAFGNANYENANVTLEGVIRASESIRDARSRQDERA